jgi:hypothetical protein
MTNKMTTTFRRLASLSALCVFAALTGCASQMTHQEMTPPQIAAAKQHPQSVNVTVLPMAKQDPVAETIAAEQLRTAIGDAIVASKTFADVKKDGGDYQLAVQIFNLQYPMFGVSMTSKIEIGWTLKRQDTGAVVWQEAITTEHTTGGTEAFVGAERLKMSIAGAIRKNIAAGLQKISALTL